MANTPQILSAALSLPNNKLQLCLYASYLEGGQIIDRADYGTGAPLAGDSALKKSMVQIDFSGDGSLEHSLHEDEIVVGWYTDIPEMRTPEFIARSIAATTTARPT